MAEEDKETTTDFDSIIGRYRLDIENKLEEFFDKKIRSVPEFGMVAEESINKLREFTLRKAKRLRPILVIQGAKAFKRYPKKEEDILIKAAISIELIQSFFLIHDDIIDDSDTRRGKPAMHNGYKTKEHGIKQAICIGDISSIFSVQSILDTSYDDSTKIKLLKRLYELTEKTCHGEMLDISFERRSIKEVKEQDIIKEIQMKTADYTVAGPLQLGALISGIEETDKNYLALGEFGLKLGTAFQIQDDILGIFGTEDKLGKSVKADIEEGKKTLLMKKTIDSLESGDDKNFLLSSLGHHISGKELERIKSIINGCGALETTKGYATELIREARDILKDILIDAEVKKFLEELCDFVITRTD